jgi:hypothetical protein
MQPDVHQQKATTSKLSGKNLRVALNPPNTLPLTFTLYYTPNCKHLQNGRGKLRFFAGTAALHFDADVHEFLVLLERIFVALHGFWFMCDD